MIIANNLHLVFRGILYKLHVFTTNNEPMKPFHCLRRYMYAQVKLLVKYNKYICMENRYSTLPEIFVQIHTTNLILGMQKQYVTKVVYTGTLFFD